jgi:hypothetical protein
MINQGCPMDRNPKASLSPHEINALRGLKRGTGRTISREEQKLLLSMGLARLVGEALRLSPAGRARLDLEKRSTP